MDVNAINVVISAIAAEKHRHDTRMHIHSEGNNLIWIFTATVGVSGICICWLSVKTLFL